MSYSYKGAGWRRGTVYRHITRKGIRTVRRQPPVATKSYVKRMIDRGKETNFHDEKATGTSITNAAQFINLTDSIAQGDAQGERIGDVIDMKSIRVSGHIVRKSTASTKTYDDVRMMLVVWRPDTAEDDLDGLGKLLEDSSTLPLHSPLVFDSAKRKKFSVLFDRHYPVTPRADGDNRNCYQIKFFKNDLGKLKFNESLTTGSGHIFLMLLGANGTAGEQSSISYSLRLTYKDM